MAIFLFLSPAFHMLSTEHRHYDVHDLFGDVMKSEMHMLTIKYEGPAKSFVAGFGLLQYYVLSNIFLLQTFEVFLLY